MRQVPRQGIDIVNLNILRVPVHRNIHRCGIPLRKLKPFCCPTSVDAYTMAVQMTYKIISML